MIRDIDWSMIKTCTKEERQSLILYIEQLIDLKYAFEEDGVYGSSAFMRCSTNVFEKAALDLVIQGYKPEMCRTVLSNLLNSSYLDHKLYLKNVIFAEFVFLMQDGETSDQYIRKILLSYLGIECAEELIDFKP